MQLQLNALTIVHEIVLPTFPEQSQNKTCVRFVCFTSVSNWQPFIKNNFK